MIGTSRINRQSGEERLFLSAQEEGRGLKNPEAVKAKQKRREEAERQAKAAGSGGETAMKVE